LDSVGQRMVITGADKSRSYTGDYMKAGEQAEEIVMYYFEAEPTIERYIDCRNNPERQDQEIDFEVFLKSGKKIFVEVKSDIHLGTSGNMLFEFARINHTVQDTLLSIRLGWSSRSRATHFIYYAPAVHSLYVVKAFRLREAMQAYTVAARKQTRIDYVSTDSIKSTLNILIPIKYVQDLKIVKLKSL
jgi:hypothetical protein